MSDQAGVAVGAANQARYEFKKRVERAIQKVLDEERAPFALSVAIDMTDVTSVDDGATTFVYRARVSATIPECW